MKENFSLLITEHQGLIYKVCNMYCDSTEDREDLFQDIVLQLWQAFSTFNGRSKITTWMYGLAINVAITRLRKEKRRSKFSPLDSDAFRVAAKDYQPDEQMILMYEAIRKLSKVERALIMLYLDDYSYKEIAEILGLTETNVGFKLSQVRTKLRTLLKTK